MEEFYPMPMFVNLAVGDVARSAAWYQRAAGFRVVFSGPPGRTAIVHLRRERYQDILLVTAQPDAPAHPGEGVTIQFQAGETSVDDIARLARQAGDTLVEGPVARPWNVRDVTLVDPDGYRLRFSEPIDMGRSFDEVMDGVSAP